MAIKYKRYRTFLEPLPSETDSYVAVSGLEIKIADCTESITLWFHMSEKQALEKLGRLRKGLDTLEQNIQHRHREKEKESTSDL